MTKNSYQNVTFKSNGGTAHGYRALPPSGVGPGLIVIQEWWGLTSHIADLVNRFAAEGFVALAPDLYGGPTTHDAAEAQELMQELPVDRAVEDLSGAVGFLLDDDAVTGSSVGVVGFCMGGGFALQMAAREGERIGAAVAFYGVPPGPHDFTGLSAEVQGHYGRNDAFVDPDAAEQVMKDLEAQSGRRPDVHWYPAGHAFLNDENLLGTYDAEQARLAWGRTVSFLKKQLGA